MLNNLYRHRTSINVSLLFLLLFIFIVPSSFSEENKFGNKQPLPSSTVNQSGTFQSPGDINKTQVPSSVKPSIKVSPNNIGESPVPEKLNNEQPKTVPLKKEQVIPSPDSPRQKSSLIPSEKASENPLNQPSLNEPNLEPSKPLPVGTPATSPKFSLAPAGTENDSNSKKPSIPLWIIILILILTILVIIMSIMIIHLKRKIPPKQTIEGEIIKAGKIKITISCSQDIGKREEQEDAFGFSDIYDSGFISEKGVLAIVADGMGGMEYGREASNLSVRKFLNYYEKNTKGLSISRSLYLSLLNANKSLLEWVKEKKIKENVGTTLLAVNIHDNNLYWISVGDSRLYIFRDGKITQLTEDHDLERKLMKDVEKGLISIREVEENNQKHALTSFIGLDEIEEINFNKEPLLLKKNDVLILCSDGLYKTLSNAEITEIIKTNNNNASKNLKDKAISKQKNKQDNITVISLFIN